MKKLATLLFVLFSVTAMSQFLRKGNHVILIRNLKTGKRATITERSAILILTTSGKRISGAVRLIKADTIFFKDTCISVSRIDKIYFQTPFALSEQPFFNSDKPAYVAGSSKFKIIIPPDSVYRKQSTYQSYLHRLNMKARKEHLATFDPLIYKNFIKWNITKLTNLELGFSYERLIAKNLTWETELSAMYGLQSAAPSDLFLSIYPYLAYDGISITTYPKYYFIPTAYVSFVFMYRYLVGDHIRTDFPESGNNELKTQYRNDYGVSLRIGFMRRYHKTVVDYFFGAGIKGVTAHDVVYGFYGEDSSYLHWLNSDHSPKVSDKSAFWPVINFGIKIGRAF